MHYGTNGIISWLVVFLALLLAIVSYKHYRLGPVAKHAKIAKLRGYWSNYQIKMHSQGFSIYCVDVAMTFLLASDINVGLL